jgi:hypothetical protein
MRQNLVYGCAIRDSVVNGELDDMKAAVRDAEKHLVEFGNVPAALELLKAEIAKAERGSRKG